MKDEAMKRADAGDRYGPTAFMRSASVIETARAFATLGQCPWRR
jgi:hypothetical protein